MFGAAAFEAPALFCAGRWDEGMEIMQKMQKMTRMIARSWRLEGPQVGHCKAQLKPQGKAAGRMFGAAAFEAPALFCAGKMGWRSEK